MSSQSFAYDQLLFYTLAHRGPGFIHQHAVDCIAADSAADGDNPIKLAFALAGRYLAIEKQYSGRQVQVAHMKIAKRKWKWPVFAIPTHRGEISIDDVLAAPSGNERDAKIHAWCGSLWLANAENRAGVIEFLEAMDSR